MTLDVQCIHLVLLSEFLRLILLFLRFVGRLSNPLVGVHGQQMDGSDRVVPGCAGLSVMQYKLCPKIYDIFHNLYISCLF